MSKNLVLFSVFTTIIVIAWIGLNIYHNATTSTVLEDMNIKTIPIDNSFKTKIIEDNLNSRKQVVVNLAEKISTASISPTITYNQSSPSSLSSELIETTTASKGAGL